MDNIYTAISLALIGLKRFAVLTDNQDKFVDEFQAVLSTVCQVSNENVAVVDLIDLVNTDEDSYHLILQEMTITKDESLEFKQVVIWKNLQYLTDARQEWLTALLNKIDRYNTNRSRTVKEPIVIDGFTIHKPELFTIVLVLQYSNGVPPINQFLKECFWFSVNCPVEDDHILLESGFTSKSDSYSELILKIKKVCANIYVSPEISGYIYSLVVFMRNHRLCSLAPNSTRLSTKAIDAIRDLCIILMAWLFYDTDRLYVTPEYVKVATRKVSYWLIDWEQSIFASDLPDYDLDVQKQIELSILTGDWYGSDWKYAKKYIESHRSVRDNSTPTGYTNSIVEDAIYAVKPPI